MAPVNAQVISNQNNLVQGTVSSSVAHFIFFACMAFLLLHQVLRLCVLLY
jgi:hypothetical protein